MDTERICERLYNSNFSETERINIAQELLMAPGMPTRLNAEIIDAIPFLGEYPSPELNNKHTLLIEADKILPEIKSIFLKIGQDILKTSIPKDPDELIAAAEKAENPLKIQKFLSIIPEGLLRGAIPPERWGYRERPFQIAVSHLGAQICAKLYKQGGEEKGRWLALSCYYTALESLFAGIKTTSYLVARYPQTVDLNLLDNILPVIIDSTPQTVDRIRSRILFEGFSVFPVHDLEDNAHCFIIQGNPTDPNLKISPSN
jgi:hypothetical protein